MTFPKFEDSNEFPVDPEVKSQWHQRAQARHLEVLANLFVAGGMVHFLHVCPEAFTAPTPAILKPAKVQARFNEVLAESVTIETLKEGHARAFNFQAGGDARHCWLCAHVAKGVK